MDLINVFSLITAFASCRVSGFKSDSKCDEYGKAVYVDQMSPVLSRRSEISKVSECGIVSVPLIVGGLKAAIKEFPHMALIGFQPFDEGEIAWDCGGTLISEQYILTAAHCMQSREKGDAKFVKLGMIDVDANSEHDIQQRKIAKVIPHPEYKKPNKNNDIALLKMDNPVKFSAYVRPACLNTKPNIAERKAIATGFGKVSYEATRGSKYLMKVVLDIIPNGECKGSFAEDKINFQNGLQDSMICAGVLTGGKDTCQGDSGGPLQIILQKPYCMYSIIGVTSFGKFCGFANSPAIYSRVYDYLPWIENIVW